MRTFATLTRTLALTLALVAPVAAGTFTFKKAQVELTSPEGWKSSEEEGTVTFTSPDESVAVVFTVLPAKDAEAASEALDTEIEKLVGEVTWPEKGDEKEVNGMPVEVWEGAAKEGTLEVSAAYFDTPAEEIMVMYYVASPEAGKKFAADLGAMLQGIKPLAAAK